MARADAAPASVTAPAKNHYVILEGRRGVAALMVLLTLVVLGKFEHDVLESVAESEPAEPSARR